MRYTIIFVSLLISLSACGQHKKTSDLNSEHTNELIHESSPYLLEHAHNPVNWYPWGDKALTLAKKENKPLIISIGYAACHWCHVMERESFMDTSVARVMNENFVCIKIDREERTDLDNIYMTASQMMGLGGGWPLNVFATPEGKPFYAGTYFQKQQWIQVMNNISDVYRNQPDKVKQQADAVTNGLQTSSIIPTPTTNQKFKKEDYEDIFSYWRGNTDNKLGGFKRAPKFPMPVGWEYVLQYYKISGDQEAFKATIKVLDKMAEGGIYDQAGGGFSRYSVDEKWLVPHFEKMLYDNGQLVSLYAHAYKLTKSKLYKNTIEQTLSFIERELTDKSGGFYSSLNADSEGEEGKFYVWTKKELDNLFDNETAEVILDYYEITERGNWEEEKNILHILQDKESVAKKHNISVEQLGQTIKKVNETILKERSKRVRPSTDDKVLTAWNALMLKGYIHAYQALSNKSYLKTALKNARFLEETMMMEDGALWRNYKDGKAVIPAFLEDYALLADAYIDLYQTTLDKHWLDLSRKLTEYAIEHFQDKSSKMFYFTTDLATDILVRKVEIQDNVIPASNSVMAHNLLRLGEYYDLSEYTSMSKQMLQIVQKDLVKGGPYYANWSRLLGMYTHGTHEVAIMGKDANMKIEELQHNYLPNTIYMGGNEENLPLLEFKLQKDKTMIYVCQNNTCNSPTEKVEDALKELNE